MEKIMNKLSVQLGDFADEIKEQADYYAHTEKGKAEIQEAAKQAGRVACETGKFIWAVAGGITSGIVQKTKNAVKQVDICIMESIWKQARLLLIWK